ncbi:unnamed protein product, partial [Symbiodinium sp. CCMP2456]
MAAPMRCKWILALLGGLLLRPAVQRLLGHLCTWLVLWLRRHRRRHILWRLSSGPWTRELAPEGLSWLPIPCAECSRWGERWQRLHAAVHHIAKPAGCRESDRCCSSTGRASLALRRAGPESTADFWLHRIEAPAAAVAWDCRNLAEEAVSNGFALDDFAASCLKRRDAGAYAHKWGVKLQEVLLDRTQLRSCVVCSIKLDDLLRRCPSLLRQAQALGRQLRHCAAEHLGEAAPRRLDAWLGFPMHYVLAELQNMLFEWHLTTAMRLQTGIAFKQDYL